MQGREIIEEVKDTFAFYHRLRRSESNGLGEGG